MLSKKYYSISEVSKICNIAMHKLRYIEKSDSNITILKIRGQRYYTKADIDYIRSKITANSCNNIDSNQEESDFVLKIDLLIAKFYNLSTALSNTQI